MYRKNFIELYKSNGTNFEEAKSEIDFALDSLFNYTYKDYVIGKLLEDWQINKLNKIIEERIRTHKPIQQIIGLSYFYGRKFIVNEHTLIPRPETELIISTILNLANKFQNNIEILDIGSGTGCIPITLVLENNRITADSVDISQEAIEISKKNALFHNIYKKINFFKSDLFENIHKKYNIIVSNPPYIPLKEKENLQIEVREFEPSKALFTNDDDGMEFYVKIIENAKKFMFENSYLVFEIGINQADKIREILINNNFKEIEIIKDYNSIERIVIAKN